MESAIMNQIIGAIVSIAITYVGFINKLRSQVSVLEEKVSQFDKQCSEVQKKFEDVNHHYAVIEEKVKHIEQRQDSHSKKNDEVINLITELKIEMVKKIGDVSVQMGKISSDVENITSTIAVFDDGIRSKSKKGKK